MKIGIKPDRGGIRPGKGEDEDSLIFTAEISLQTIARRLTCLEERCRQVEIGKCGEERRMALKSEFQSLASQIDQIARNERFTGFYLLEGLKAGSHVGCSVFPDTIAGKTGGHDANLPNRTKAELVKVEEIVEVFWKNSD